MKEITALVSRNRKLFFKDKGMLFSSMITPVILIVLYATFLANVYKDSFVSATKDMIDLPDKIIDGTVAAQLAAPHESGPRSCRQASSPQPSDPRSHRRADAGRAVPRACAPGLEGRGLLPDPGESAL